ncbi:hypothetical protein ABH926_008934 [Catenulispora sp. GP43]|uniref:DUF2637 domain-containing protein n=1 Tax=Catenulispora sp. GP43 TaxID=3156263 RepID=UPI003515AD5F
MHAVDHPGAPAPPVPITAAADAAAASPVPAIVGLLKAAVTAVGVAVGALGLLGFVNSFHRVDATAQPSFHGLAWTVPTGIDLGIFVFSALDIVLAILHMRIVWLRLIPWALTAVTIQLNIANQPGQPPLSAFDKLAHGVLPAMWALSVEVGAHVVRKRARLTSDKRMDRVRLSRWVLAPVPTLGLWRRMVLWEERSYPAALARERTRVLAKTDMQDRYGRMWRFTAPRRERALYRLGELTPTARPADTNPDTVSGARPNGTDTNPDIPADAVSADMSGRADTAADTNPDIVSGARPDTERTSRRTRGADTAAKVARLVAKHPDMPTVDIARKVGVTDRTVRRHLDKLTANPAAPVEHVNGHDIGAAAHA